jgi:hypothetical protein
MKLLQVIVATLGLAVGSAFAGPIIDKNPLPVEVGCPCFFPGLQVGAFASGYLPRGENEESAAGGGVNFTYFFTENIGLEYSYSVHATDSEMHINALDLIYRLPIGFTCWAPYVMGGGAVYANSFTEGAYRLGGGLEYRLDNCIAVFSDATYNWIQEEPDALQVRLGLRVPF